MRLIYNLTQDWTRRDGGSIQEYKVKSMQDQSFISSEQILTEFGICYGTNNYMLKNISTKLAKSIIYLHRVYCFTFINWLSSPDRNIVGIGEPTNEYFDDTFYDGKTIIDILRANQFDGTVGYTHKGFNTGYIKVYGTMP